MSSQDAAPAAPAASHRPRLKLKPRDPEAVARMEAERQASMGKSPFGNAKPREAVIAGRMGKSEEEVLKEEVNTRYKLHLEEKRTQEARVQEAEEAAAQEEDPVKRTALEKDAAARRLELEQMLEGFEKMTLEAALAGSAPRVSSLRRSHQDAAGEAQQATQQQHGGGRYHPTQGYHMGRNQQQLDDGLPPSRGFPNGQYGKGYVPRSQGFPDYQQPRPQHRYHQHLEGDAGSSSSSSFSKQGSRDAYQRDDSDAGFYDTPSTFDPAAVAGRGSHSRGSYNRREGGRANNNNNGGYYQQDGNQRQYSQSGRGSDYSGSGGFGAPPPGSRPLAGQGIGGEIKFDEDTFATSQDRF